MHFTILNVIVSLLLIAIIVLMIKYRKTYFVKITWRYALILLPFILIILIKLFTKKPPNTDDGKFALAINDIKGKLNEAQMISAIEVTAAREDDKIKLEELKKATDIKNDAERRKALVDLMD